MMIPVGKCCVFEYFNIEYFLYATNFPLRKIFVSFTLLFRGINKKNVDYLEIWLVP